MTITCWIMLALPGEVKHIEGRGETPAPRRVKKAGRGRVGGTREETWGSAGSRERGDGKGGEGQRRSKPVHCGSQLTSNAAGGHDSRERGTV